MKILLADGQLREFEGSMSVAQIAAAISGKLAKKALAARIDGKIFGLDTVPLDGSRVEILTFEDEEGKKALWHTASHVMAQAVLRLFPETKLAIGPAIETGFYYDFDAIRPFDAADLEKIEEEMRRITQEDLPVERIEMPRDKALEYGQSV